MLACDRGACSLTGVDESRREELGQRWSWVVVGGGEDHGEELCTGWETQKENLDFDTEIINRGKLVPPVFITHLTLLLCSPSLPARVMCMNLITR